MATNHPPFGFTTEPLTMFLDARKIENGVIVETTVCIVGAGVAGITLALELEKYGIESCLLESGGFTPDKMTSELSNGENTGFPYTFGDGSRSRYLGGSSNCWGGWCAPLVEFDFSKRDWVNHSGWPINLDDLRPYYERSHDVLKLGPYNYDSAFWIKAINRPDVRSVPFTSGAVKNGISQFSPPAKLGILYGKELKESKAISTILYANVTDIEVDETGANVKSVTVKTLSGNSFVVSAKMFVLSAGGIENARLMLSSNKVQKDGIGNENDLVGRYFMDHPRVISGSISLNKEWANNRLYDIRYHYQDALVAANNVCVASQLVLSPEIMQKEQILHSRVSMYSVFPGEGSKGVLAANRIKDAVFKKKFEGLNVGKDMLSVFSHPFDITAYGVAAKFRIRSWIKDVRFQIIMEQAPNPSSRVTLADAPDRLGMRRVKVNWQLGELEQRTFNRTLRIVADEFKAGGVASDVSLHPPLENNNWPEGLTGTWHHMGTTRMHDSPKSGVVDKNCKVYSTNNLYIGGSSVFPTGGSNFPTITLTALAIRLSDHLRKELEKTGHLRTSVMAE